MGATPLDYQKAREADLPTMWKGKLHAGNQRHTSAWSPCCGEGNRKDRASLSKVGGIWRWRCFACGKGGTAIDLVAITEGMSPAQAVGHILAQSPAEAATKKPKVAADKAPAQKKGLVEALMPRLFSGPLDRGVVAYLEGRGIRPEIIELAHRRGFLGSLPSKPEDAVLWLEREVGRKPMAEAGLWHKRWPAAAYRPLLFRNGSGRAVELRRIREDDSPKAIQYGVQDYPLVWKPEGDVRRVMVVEGGIDLLSVVDLGEAEDALLVGIFGTSAWRDAWGRRIAAKYPDAEWVIGTDADESGEACAEAIRTQLEVLGRRWTRRLPFSGKDWNDALRSIA